MFFKDCAMGNTQCMGRIGRRRKEKRTYVHCIVYHWVQIVGSVEWHYSFRLVSNQFKPVKLNNYDSFLPDSIRERRYFNLLLTSSDKNVENRPVI